MPTPVVAVLIAVCVFFGAISVITDVFDRQLAFVSFLGYAQPWRFITSGFIHFGPAHLFLNMWALYLVGPPIEIAVGKLRFLALYLFSILGGSTFVLLWETLPGTQLSLTAGASGAIFGLFGALIVLQRQLQQDIRAMVTLVVINFAWGFISPGISWQGHFGGLLAGLIYAALVLLLTPRLRAVSQRRKAVSSGLPYSEIRTSVFDKPAVLITLQVTLTLVLGAGLYLLNLWLLTSAGLAV